MFRLFIYVWMICSLISCSSSYRAPVEDRQVKSRSAAPSVYTVQRGDTMYSITWRYGLDYRSVAAANGIASPYMIYPGQKLYLKAKAPKSAKYTPVKTAPVKPAQTQPSKSRVPASSGSSAKKTTPAPVPAAKSKSPDKADAKISKWRSPTSGKVIRKYSSSVHKGIDISGKRGDPIYAVAAGKVVYSGDGIVGYGELLIIKHNEVYLSAYGHNNRLLVSEGEQVKAGQKIAEKGSSGTDTVKLHFEIRREGKPVDPQKLLP